MSDLPLPSFCDTLPAHQRRALLNNREAYAAFYAAAKTAEIEAECARLREALSEIASATGFDNIGNWARNQAKAALRGNTHSTGMKETP